MQDLGTNSKKIDSQNRSSFLVTMFDTVLQLHNAIKCANKTAKFNLNFTMLIRLSDTQIDDTFYQEKIKKELGIKATTALFSSPNIGTIYSIGLLTDMFLQSIGTKVLGELKGGIYGILRGLEVDETKAANCTEKLRDGHCMLIISGDPEDIMKLPEIL